jgi:ABC-type dipeptide/oligopeptide/nickel transport system permease component
MALVPVLMLVSVLVFSMLYLLPGDPLIALVGEEGAHLSAEDAAVLRKSLGLDQPVAVQYLRYARGILRGDLGRSIRSSKPVVRVISEQVKATLELSVVSLVISLCLGVVLGVTAACRRATRGDTTVMLVSLFGLSMPSFWLGLMMIIVFSYGLDWLPSMGGGTLKQLVMPASVLGLGGMGTLARLTRSAMLDTLNQEYIRTARSKGLTERVVVYKHALRNALLPVMTVVGMTLGHILGGSVVVETVFSRPGIGRIVVAAINDRDFPIVQGVVLMSAMMYVLTNLLVDLLYGVVDPRIRFD